MKTYVLFYLSLLLFIPIGASQSSDVITNFSDRYVGHEDALINDVIKLEFDKKNASVSFNFPSEDTQGIIGGLDFKISFNPEDTDNAYFKGSAAINTLETGNFLRDGHLMWEKFFYKKKYPKLFFESTEVVAFGNNTYKVIGTLMIKGISKEVIINFSLDSSKLLLGKTTIYTSDYGVSISDQREENKLDIVFSFPILQ